MRSGMMAAVVLAGLLNVACSNEPTSGSKSRSAQITVGDYYFSPNNVTIAPGDTVIFIWGGSDGHNVAFGTAGSPSNCPLQSGGFCFRTFPAAGTFSFVCSPHSSQMYGTINVQ